MAYVKENGFLGIVSYDEYEDDLFVTSKSDPTGDFAKWFKEILLNTLGNKKVALKTYLKKFNLSFVFECIDIKNDPHVIDYPESKVVLLDIVYNDIDFKKYDYKDMCQIADDLGLEHKKLAYTIDSWQDFFDWYYDVTAEGYEFERKPIEGFVIEDMSGFMVKLKLNYYNFWKFMRSVAHEAIRKGYIQKTSALVTPLANEFYSWVKTLHEWENKDEIPKDICTLRRMFYESKK